MKLYQAFCMDHNQLWVMISSSIHSNNLMAISIYMYSDLPTTYLNQQMF